MDYGSVGEILFPYYKVFASTVHIIKRERCREDGMTLRKEDTQIRETFHVQEATSPFFTELHQKYDSYSAENESFSIKTVREADL